MALASVRAAFVQVLEGGCSAPDVLADGTGTPRASPDDPRSSQILASSCLILATFLGPAPDVLADAMAIPGRQIAVRNAYLCTMELGRT